MLRVNINQQACGFTSVLFFLVDGVQGRVKEDGFLTPAEEAEWLSTMKLGENEAQPRLKHSSFLCFNTERQQQVHTRCIEYGI